MRAAQPVHRCLSSSVAASPISTTRSTTTPIPGAGDSTRTNNIRTELMRLFEQGIGHDQQAIRGTTWAAYNAVTEWVDHHRPTRNAIPELRANNRLKSAWFGSGAKLKAKAWETALELATIG